MPAVQSPPRHARAREQTPYERYLATFPEGMKGDLIGGVAVIDMSTSWLHENLQAFLLTILRAYVRERHLGVVGGSRSTMRVDDENGYEPDVFFVRQARAGIVEGTGISGPVDVAVEIVSPSSGKRDRVTKFDGYERVGVPEYWLVDPERREASFYRLDGAPYEAGGAYRAVPLQDGQFVSEAVPGFRFDPQTLFADPLPSEFAVLRALLREA